MRHPTAVDSGESSQALAFLQERLGFVPNLYKAQVALPTVLEAEAKLLDAVLFQTRSLSRVQKECVLLVLSAARSCVAGAAIHYQTLRLLSVPEQRLNLIAADYRTAKLSPGNEALVSIALRIGLDGTTVSNEDLIVLASHDLNDEGALEVILTAALGNFLCTMAIGLCIEPDFAAPPLSGSVAAEGRSEIAAAALLRTPVLPSDFPPFLHLREQFGFLPRIFPAQSLRPEVLEAEAGLISALFSSNGFLSRTQKESIFRGRDRELVRDQGFTGGHLVEAAAIRAAACFLRTLQAGFGLPDLEIGALEEKPHLAPAHLRHTDVKAPADPDMGWVDKVRHGDLYAFEELMNRHSRRVYRTLIGVLGDAEEARDAMQDTFLKAFQHLDTFQGRSRFSTWLVSIASNTAIQCLRDRQPSESLDESDSEESFRPRQVQAWTDNPEQLYSQVQARSLVESGIMKLPAKYRVVVILRDIEQLSTEESAAALSLGIPALKARLHRGRLMLREALAPHFAAVSSKSNAKGVMS
jgi:RNA polymerase sigma-70 factor (ECF subfamily)